MAAMKREKQYDMFDVAIGACTLLDYLFQRYSENDLSTTFWVDPKDEVDELLAPEPLPDGRPGNEPVVRPVQGPRAPARVAARPFGPPLPPEGLEDDKAASPPPTVEPESPDSTVAQSKPALPAVDGMDSLATKSQPPSPGGETFKASKPPEPGVAPDSFQASNETDRDRPPGNNPEEKKPASPSMEDLLAQFHKATQDYNHRSTLMDAIESADNVSADTSSSENESSSQEKTDPE